MNSVSRRFKQQKDFALKRLNKAMKKGEVDKEIISLINYINSLKDFYTTSTCAGRISILQDLGRKIDNFALKKWHREAKIEEVEENLRKIPKTGIIWLIYEPAILHVVARDLKKAKFLLQLALSSGFKHTGIQGFREERFLIEIFSTGRMDVPIAGKGKLLISEEYLSYLTKLANKKFRKGQERLKKFEEILRENLK